MPHEVITISVGQCGNQIGSQFWDLLMKEHGINPLSRRMTDEAIQLDQTMGSGPSDRKDIHFYHDDIENFVPRAVLVDLEPRVISHVQSRYNQVFNPESIYMDRSGGGAGNNWATGYSKAEEIAEELSSMLGREVEGCDSLAAFQLIHSISGGSGSGVGSWFLEFISDTFPKVLSNAISVVPDLNPDGAADITVGPYNSMLTLKRLAEETDSCTIVDNAALNSIAANKLNLPSATVEETNGVVAQAMTALTSGIRFPGTSYDDLVTLNAQLVPMPRQQFLCTSLTPITNYMSTVQSDGKCVVRRTTPFDVMRKLQDPCHCLASIPFDRPEYKFLSCINLIKGDIGHLDVWDASVKINESILQPLAASTRRTVNRTRLSFVPWVPNAIKTSLVKKSRYYTQMHKVSGLMIGNNTGISSILDQLLASFNRLLNRQAFIDPYRKAFGGSLEEFYDASSVVEAVSADYKAANSTDYMRRVFGDCLETAPGINENMNSDGHSTYRSYGAGYEEDERMAKELDSRSGCI